jgi:hypothetical protein
VSGLRRVGLAVARDERAFRCNAMALHWLRPERVARRGRRSQRQAGPDLLGRALLCAFSYKLWARPSRVVPSRCGRVRKRGGVTPASYRSRMLVTAVVSV